MLKILLLLGIAAKSYEIILKIYNLLAKVNPTIDLYDEMCKDEEFKDMLASDDGLAFTLEQEDKSLEDLDTNLKFEDPLKNYNVVIENCTLYEIDLSKIDSLAFDKHYIYLFSEAFGLAKIGADTKEGVEKGKLYEHQPRWKGYCFNILCIGNMFYMRQHVLREQKPLPDGLDKFRHHPFLIFKTDDLTNPINSKYLELYEQNKKDLDNEFTKEYFDRPCLERIEYNNIKGKELGGSDRGSTFDGNGYRVILDTQFATDGKFLYVPTYYVQHYTLRERVEKSIIEKYCPKTWKLLDQFVFFDKESAEHEEYDSDDSKIERYEELLQSSNYFKTLATNGIKF